MHYPRPLHRLLAARDERMNHRLVSQSYQKVHPPLDHVRKDQILGLRAIPPRRAGPLLRLRSLSKINMTRIFHLYLQERSQTLRVVLPVLRTRFSTPQHHSQSIHLLLVMGDEGMTPQILRTYQMIHHQLRCLLDMLDNLYLLGLIPLQWPVKRTLRLLFLLSFRIVH